MSTECILFLNALWNQWVLHLIKTDSKSASVKTFCLILRRLMGSLWAVKLKRERFIEAKLSPTGLEILWSRKTIGQGDLNLHLKSLTCPVILYISTWWSLAGSLTQWVAAPSTLSIQFISSKGTKNLVNSSLSLHASLGQQMGNSAQLENVTGFRAAADSRSVNLEMGTTRFILHNTWSKAYSRWIMDLFLL